MPVVESTFGITYDGPALETGRMPVKDLAPALLAVGDLFALSSALLYPELDPVAVKVEATKEGSFAVRLLLDAEEAWGQVVSLFGAKEASALANLIEIVLFTGGGLVWLIKTIRRRRVTAVHQLPQPGTVRLTLDDQTTLEIPSDTWRLYRNVEVRKHTREIVEPLAREGVESITFTAEGADEPVVVEKGDLPSYTAVEDAEAEPLLEQEQEMYLEIVSVAFIRDNKWRLSTGDHVFWASVHDDDFLERVETGEESFRKGDVLRCLVEITQTRDAEGLHTEYRVLEIRDHLPRATQLRLGD